MEWEKFDKSVITSTHGDMYLYRDLYKGRHADYSTRATHLIKNGEIIDYVEGGHREALNVRTPYLIFNISKIICNIPALLISRSMGEVQTNHKHEREAAGTASETNIIEGTDDETINDVDSTDHLHDHQQLLLDQIVRNSKLTRKHKSNIVQHQVDGGIVGVPIVKNGQIQIQFKERNVYYPHEDGKGADLVYEMDNKDDDGNDFVHVYTERETGSSLETMHRLYKRGRTGKLSQLTDEAFIKEVLQVNRLSHTFQGRLRSFIDYWGNNVTFMDPLGVSELEGQEGKQEEVNWTVTRAAQTFERNGKPRISVSSEVMERLTEIAEDKYGDASKIDHRDLEITEMDEQGNSIQIHQIDISNIGDMTYVKDIIKQMLSETNTSEKATDFLNDGSTSSAQSGVAKFYDLFISLIKAETLRDEYIEFLQNLFESALWLANKQDDSVIIEKPIIITKSMIPTPKQETDANSMKKYREGVQSLEQTIREMHLDKSDEYVEKELDRIQSERGSDDSMTLNSGRQSLLNMFGNRDPEGNPTDEDGNPVEE